MVNARPCETARLALFFASPRHFDFLDCETETSKRFECERETCRLSENLLTVNKLYYFPGHDLISGQEIALSGFPLIFF